MQLPAFQRLMANNQRVQCICTINSFHQTKQLQSKCRGFTSSTDISYVLALGTIIH